MFITDSDTFKTRITNPGKVDFCIRGIPGRPVVRAGSYVDLDGAYTKLFREEWYSKAVASGLKFKLFTVLDVEQVKSLSALPACDMAAPAAKQPDPDAAPAAPEAVSLVVPPAVEDKSDKTPFKTARAAAESRDEALPAGVVKISDLEAAVEANTIHDRDLMRGQRGETVTETIVGEVADETPATPAAPAETASKPADTRSGKGGKGGKGKPRAWLGV